MSIISWLSGNSNTGNKSPISGIPPVALVIYSLLAFGCGPVGGPLEERLDETRIASVGDAGLYLSEVTKLIQDSISPQDSQIFIQNYADRWVRDQLLVREAEKNIPGDINIEQLVKDYRSSLLVHHFEQQLLNESLDTLITEAQILDFYKKNKDQFQNDKDLVRAYFIKLKKPFPNQQRMESWWKDASGNNLNELRNYCQNYASFFILESDKWIEYSELARQLPRGSLRFKDLKPDYERNFADFNFQYLIRVFETVSSTENAPVSMVADQAKMIILHERKLKLLEKIKQELYTEAIRSGSVKIMTK